MMNIYQTNFANNSSILLKKKRLRHVNNLTVKNLKINSNRFNVWFTLHQNKQTKAFYISEKKENDRNPKWTLVNTNKLPHEQFILRIWFSNLCVESPLLSRQSSNRVRLIIEMEVSLACLTQLNQEVNNIDNLIIFEMFGLNFTERFFKSDKRIEKIVRAADLKNSYNLNMLIRLHDFQRVMHETQLKTSSLKTSSLAKFDASSKLVQLQVKREQKYQRINFYKEQLDRFNQSIAGLSEHNAGLKSELSSKQDKFGNLKKSIEKDRDELERLKLNIQALAKQNFLIEAKLKKRQKQLVNDLSEIFKIENLEDVKVSSVAIGDIIQIIQMLSVILVIPLRYPLIFRASQSFIIEKFSDQIANEYALFKQDSANEQPFLYAINLLNKNIAQFRILLDAKTNSKQIDPSDAFSNLKWIFDYFKLV